MRWPWSKPEERQTAVGYTAALTAALEAGASGSAANNAPLATAALEIAAGLYARCMAAALVKDAEPEIAAALSPPVLAMIARNLIRRGEDHHKIIVRGGRVELRPLAFAYAHGRSADPMAWTYSATEYGPTDSVHTWLRADALMHTRFAVDASRPWLGMPPWSWAGDTSGAIAALERMVANEAKSPHGHVLGLPETPQVDQAGNERPLDAFRADLAKAKGRTLLTEFSGQWKTDAPSGGGRSKIEHITYGLDRSLIDPLRTAAGRDILAACGVPPSLVVANSDGTAQRESLRRFLHTGLAPMARLIEAEARLKLDSPGLTLDLNPIHAADVAGRARSWKAFLESGMDPDDAAANTGVVTTRPIVRPTKKAKPPEGAS